MEYLKRIMVRTNRKLGGNNILYILIYLLTVTGLTPGGSSTVYIYT